VFHHINVASKNIHQVYDDTALLEKPYFWWKIEKYVEVGIYRVLASSDRTEYLDIRRTKLSEQIKNFIPMFCKPLRRTHLLCIDRLHKTRLACLCNI
jgi:hypothetical protein